MDRSAVCSGPSPICSVVSTDDAVFLGTQCGELQAWRLTGCAASPPTRPIASTVLASREPVLHLHVVPDAGLLLHLCSGSVSACTLDTLRHVRTVHRSRAVSFDIGETAPAATLGVCAGHALVWCHVLTSTPRTAWKRLLPQPTRAVHVGLTSTVVAASSSCYVMCTRSGETLAEVALGKLALPIRDVAPRGGPSSLRILALTSGALLLVPCGPHAAGAANASPADGTARLVIDAESGARRVLDVGLLDPPRGRLIELEETLPADGGHVDDVAVGTAALAFLRGDGIVARSPAVRRRHATAHSAAELAASLPEHAGAHAGAPSPTAGALCVHGTHVLVSRGSVLWRYSLVPPEADASNVEEYIRGILCRGDAPSEPAPAEATRHPLVIALSELTLALDHDRVQTWRYGSPMRGTGVDGARRGGSPGGPCHVAPDETIRLVARFVAGLARAMRQSAVMAAPLLRHGASSELAERWAFGGPAAAAALGALTAHDAAAHEPLRRGAAAVVDEGHAAMGIDDAIESALRPTRALWGALSAATYPSDALHLVVHVCDAVSTTLARERSAEPSTEEILPCISYTAARAIVAEPARAAHILARLRLAASHMCPSDERNRAGYCLTTVHVALRYVADQAPEDLAVD